MYKAVLLLFLMTAGVSALAFDMNDCMERSKGAPYEMSDDEARAVCETKVTQSGTGDLTRFHENLPLKATRLDNTEFTTNMNKYMRSGEVKMSACVGWCANKTDWRPKCPAGYTIAESSMSDMHHGGYHGRYPIRSGLCMRGR